MILKYTNLKIRKICKLVHGSYFKETNEKQGLFHPFASFNFIIYLALTDALLFREYANQEYYCFTVYCPFFKINVDFRLLYLHKGRNVLHIIFGFNDKSNSPW